jgi:hypothetical protein
MNAAQVNTLGGTCELLGLVTVAWGLVDVARYRGDLERPREWLDARRRVVVVTVRKLLRRPGRSVVVHAEAAAALAIASAAMGKGMRGPFTPQPDQSLEDQIAELDAAVTTVREELAQLGETTTGGLRLEIDGVLGVLIGVIFMTWPENVATWFPSWPPFRIAMVLVFGYVALRLFRAWLRARQARLNAPVSNRS